MKETESKRSRKTSRQQKPARDESYRNNLTVVGLVGLKTALEFYTERCRGTKWKE